MGRSKCSIHEGIQERPCWRCNEMNRATGGTKPPLQRAIDKIKTLPRNPTIAQINRFYQSLDGPERAAVIKDIRDRASNEGLGLLAIMAEEWRSREKD